MKKIGIVIIAVTLLATASVFSEMLPTAGYQDVAWGSNRSIVERKYPGIKSMKGYKDLKEFKYFSKLEDSELSSVLCILFDVRNSWIQESSSFIRIFDFSGQTLCAVTECYNFGWENTDKSVALAKKLITKYGKDFDYYYYKAQDKIILSWRQHQISYIVLDNDSIVYFHKKDYRNE